MNDLFEYDEKFLFPATLFIAEVPYKIITVLGSCVAVCIWDKVLKIGGMNHYMLPLWNGNGLASPKYGNIAIPKLVEELSMRGSQKKNMVVKVFGGGNVIESISKEFSIGEKNIQIAFRIISEIGLNISGSSLGGEKGRKIMFNSYTGEVFQKYLEKATTLQNLQIQISGI